MAQITQEQLVERRPECVRFIWLWFGASLWRRSLAEFMERLADEFVERTRNK